MEKGLRVETLQDIRNAFTDGLLQKEKRYIDDLYRDICTGAELFEIAFNSSYGEDVFEGTTFTEIED